VYVVKKAGFTVVAATLCCVVTGCHVGVHQVDSAVRLDRGSQQMMKSPDTAFAIRAARGGVAEVQLGKLAGQKGSDPDVKAFGQKMVEDHTKANEKLTAIARKQGITLPSAMDPRDQSVYNKLQRLSGPQFDRTYMKAMVKDHAQDIKEFLKEANKGKDPQIKSFAADTLPTLQAHLQLARSDAEPSRDGSAF
jgi:putative membrane protein